jgi:ankyrin repeat protein
MLLSDPRLNIAIQDNRGYTALHLAVIYDDPVAVQILFDNTRIDVNHLDSTGNSALLLAATTYDGLNPKRNEIIDLLLLNSKTSANERDKRGRSVLWHAANTGVVVQRYQLSYFSEGNIRLYIYNEKIKLISNQLSSFYRYLVINSDGSAWFLICTSLISQQRVFDSE